MKGLMMTLSSFPFPSADCASGLLRSSPQYLDGWAMPKSFIVQLGESPFCAAATWKMIWEQQVGMTCVMMNSLFVRGGRADLPISATP